MKPDAQTEAKIKALIPEVKRVWDLTKTLEKRNGDRTEYVYICESEKEWVDVRIDKESGKAHISITVGGLIHFLSYVREYIDKTDPYTIGSSGSGCECGGVKVYGEGFCSSWCPEYEC